MEKSENIAKVLSECAEYMNLCNCDECVKFEDIKQKTGKLEATIDCGDEQRLRETAARLIDVVGI